MHESVYILTPSLLTPYGHLQRVRKLGYQLAQPAVVLPEQLSGWKGKKLYDKCLMCLSTAGIIYK